MDKNFEGTFTARLREVLHKDGADGQEVRVVFVDVKIDAAGREGLLALQKAKADVEVLVMAVPRVPTNQVHIDELINRDKNQPLPETFTAGAAWPREGAVPDEGAVVNEGAPPPF